MEIKRRIKWFKKKAVSMTLEEMRKKKREYGFTNEQISDYIGVPLATVQKIFAGVAESLTYMADGLKSQGEFLEESAEWTLHRSMIMSVSFMSGMKLNKYILPPGESKLGQTARYIPELRAVNRYYLGICTMDLV